MYKFPQGQEPQMQGFGGMLAQALGAGRPQLKPMEAGFGRNPAQSGQLGFKAEQYLQDPNLDPARRAQLQQRLQNLQQSGRYGMPQGMRGVPTMPMQRPGMGGFPARPLSMENVGQQMGEIPNQALVASGQMQIPGGGNLTPYPLQMKPGQGGIDPSVFQAIQNGQSINFKGR